MSRERGKAGWSETGLQGTRDLSPRWIPLATEPLLEAQPGALDIRAQYLVQRLIAGRILESIPGASRLQQRLDHARELALRMTLLHQAVVKRPPKGRGIMPGIADIQRVPTLNEQFHEAT